MKSIALEVGTTEWAVRQLIKQTQLGKDTKRMAKKADRKEIQAENAIEILNKEVLEALKVLGKKLPRGKRRTGKFNTDKPVAVVHLSDNHMNELISTPSNTFDLGTTTFSKVVSQCPCGASS